MSDLWASFKISADAEAYIRALSSDKMAELIQEIDSKFSNGETKISGEQRAKIDAIHEIIMDCGLTKALNTLADSAVVSEANFLILVDDCPLEKTSEYEGKLKGPEVLPASQTAVKDWSVDEIVQGMDL